MAAVLAFFAHDKDAPFRCVSRREGNRGLLRLAVLSWLILVGAQIYMLVTFTGEQISDAAGYLGGAVEHAAAGLWYPSAGDIHHQYFHGNGYVNLLILTLRFTKDIRVMFAYNILFCQIMLFSGLYITEKLLKNADTVALFAVFFCLLNTFWSETTHLRAEYPFTALAFLSFALLFARRDLGFLAGIVMALANWVRPLGLAFMVGAVLIRVYQGRGIRSIVKLLLGFGLTVGLIGLITYFYCGHFVYQATTLGYNLIMSAHDHADGSFMDMSPYISIPEELAATMIYKDYDAFYIQASLDWILKNPGKYLGQIPAKLFYLFATETYSGSTFFNNEFSTAGMDYIQRLLGRITGSNGEAFTFADLLICLDQLWYMLIMVLAAAGLVLCVKRRQWRAFLPLFMALLGGTAITVLVVGNARYHFPYYPIFFLLAAYAAEAFLEKHRCRIRQK